MNQRGFRMPRAWTIIPRKDRATTSSVEAQCMANMPPASARLRLNLNISQETIHGIRQISTETKAPVRDWSLPIPI